MSRTLQARGLERTIAGSPSRMARKSPLGKLALLGIAWRDKPHRSRPPQHTSREKNSALRLSLPDVAQRRLLALVPLILVILIGVLTFERARSVVDEVQGAERGHEILEDRLHSSLARLTPKRGSGRTCSPATKPSSSPIAGHGRTSRDLCVRSAALFRETIRRRLDSTE